MLVYGGTYGMDGGNRAREDAQDLKPCDLNALRAFEIGINQATTVKELSLVLDYLAENNMNIVGSRGYVYNAGNLGRIMRTQGLDMLDVTMFPRTAGLRGKLIDLLAR